MVQSHSWEANWFEASQDIPHISRNPKVHYRTHRRPPPVSILDQPNPVHIPTSHLLEIHPNIIYPSTPRSPQWFLPSGFPSKILYTPLSPHPCSPHAQPISFFSILSPARYWVSRTNHLAWFTLPSQRRYLFALSVTMLTQTETTQLLMIFACGRNQKWRNWTYYLQHLTGEAEETHENSE